MKRRNLFLAGALLVVAGCATATAPKCDYRNHSGVCETYAPLTSEDYAILALLQARDPGGDIILGSYYLDSQGRRVYRHLNDPHNPR